MDFQYITYATAGPVARIFLNRADKRNAQSKELLRELDQAVRHADKDADVRVIVLGGHGEHFSAGHDLKQAHAERSEFQANERWSFEKEVYYDICLSLRNVSKPTIAQVQGACIAAGFMIANMCDLIVASSDAYFADPVVQSMSAASVEVLIHPWVLGLRKAKEFLFTGERIDAQEALRLGMVNKVTDRADLEAEVDVLAAKIARADPFAMMLTKRSLNRAWDAAGFTASLDAHFDVHQLSHQGPAMQARFNAGISSAVSDGKGITAKP